MIVPPFYVFLSTGFHRCVIKMRAGERPSSSASASARNATASIVCYSSFPLRLIALSHSERNRRRVDRNRRPCADSARILPEKPNFPSTDLPSRFWETVKSNRAIQRERRTVFFNFEIEYFDNIEYRTHRIARCIIFSGYNRRNVICRVE